MIPEGRSIWNVLGLIVAYLFGPGSSVDIHDDLAMEILLSANSISILVVLIGVLIAVIDVILYHRAYHDISTDLRKMKFTMTWRDLWIPDLLLIIIVILGILALR